jgi:predicted DNA-binding transcriptional regulator YafY
MLKKLYKRLKSLNHLTRRAFYSPRYYIVYKNKDGKIKTYQIGNIDLWSSFGNKEDNRKNAGFKAYCFGRQQVRSFRHDRIISLTKK